MKQVKRTVNLIPCLFHHEFFLPFWVVHLYLGGGVKDFNSHRFGQDFLFNYLYTVLFNGVSTTHLLDLFLDFHEFSTRCPTRILLFSSKKNLVQLQVRHY